MELKDCAYEEQKDGPASIMVGDTCGNNDNPIKASILIERRIFREIYNRCGIE